MVCFEQNHEKCNFFYFEIVCKDYWFIIALSLISKRVQKFVTKWKFIKWNFYLFRKGTLILFGLPAYTLGYIILYFISWYFQSNRFFGRIYDYFQSGLFPKKNRKSPHEIVQAKVKINMRLIVWSQTNRKFSNFCFSKFE